MAAMSLSGSAVHPTILDVGANRGSHLPFILPDCGSAAPLALGPAYLTLAGLIRSLILTQCG